jgi:ATPase subunit of ABC transporter with duplicated ATPase domains
MLNIHNLSVSFGGFFLRSYFSIGCWRDRVGLVGKKGAGKSTNAKMLAKILLLTQV